MTTTPSDAPSQMPGQTPSQMPGQTPGHVPGHAPSQTPTRSPRQAPAGAPPSPPPGVQLVSDLVARIPEFREVYERHVLHQGDVLPHVFFWDVVQNTVRSFLGDAPDAADWRRTLAFLEEQSCRGVIGVDEVIVTSFLGDLPSPQEPGHAIVHQLGPVMAAKFVRIRPLG
ncbi:hypothetical protein [Streptomyces sp. NPDC048266]|uniref:hypothetical protein n=1 Tax=Streptomyces sp. NPDC048266 TaxID=3155787 RepID=UPI0033DD3A23